MQFRIFALACAILPQAAAAQALKGKTVRLLIGPGNAGSGYDLYGRLMGRHLGRFLPGQPNVLVQNMNGGAGLLLANHLFNSAARDGTEIGMIADSAPLVELIGLVGVRYRAAEFNWIGRVTTVVNLTMTWRTSKVRNIEDAMRIEAPISTGPAGANAWQMPALMNAVVGTKFKLVTGYPSTAAMQMAMERGETEGAYGDLASLKTTHPDWLRDNMLNTIVQYTLQRDHELPQTPTAIELARTEEERQLLRLATGNGGIGRHLVAPPNLPPEMVAALRDGFDAMTRDSEFLADAARSTLPIDALDGANLQKIVATVSATPASVIARAKGLLSGN